MNRLVVLIDSGMLKYSTRFVARGRLGIPTTAPLMTLANHPSAMSAIYDVLTVSLRSKLTNIEAGFGKIDRCIVCLDIGDSWRCQVPKTLIPGSNEASSIAYKGHRRTDDPEELAAMLKLNGIYKQCIDFICQNSGIDMISLQSVESDDFMCILGKTYAMQGDTSVILSKDADITQAVQTFNSGGRVIIAQPDNHSGLNYIIDQQTKNDMQYKDIFSAPKLPQQTIIALQNAQVVWPEHVMLSKILNGDGSDDISPVMCRVKNGKSYKLTTKQFISILESFPGGMSVTDLYEEPSILSILRQQHQSIHKQSFDDLPAEWQKFYLDKFAENRKMVVINEPELGQHYYDIFDAAKKQLRGNTPVIAFPNWQVLQSLNM